MKHIDSLQLELLTTEECLIINGGDMAMHDLGVLCGAIARGLWELCNTSGGGYSYGKCGY